MAAITKTGVFNYQLEDQGTGAVRGSQMIPPFFKSRMLLSAENRIFNPSQPVTGCKRVLYAAGYQVFPAAKPGDIARIREGTG